MFFKAIVGLTSILLVTVIWYISPIMKPFPQLTGPYQVGIKTLELASMQQFEAQEERRLVLHVFYPADDAVRALERAPYLGDKMPHFQKAVADHLRVPLLIAQLLFRGIRTHAATDTPIYDAENPYPVILFSHGLLGLPSDTYAAILGDIASHGYIVMAVDHPYFNELTLYRDGKIITSRELSAQFQRMSPQQQKEFQTTSIERYKSDMKRVIDQLEVYNQSKDGIFFHNLDLDRITVMGHSAGGTAAIEFCRNDPRCKAAIDLDGWYDHVIGATPIKKPLLLIFGSKGCMDISQPTAEYLERKKLTRKEYFEQMQQITDHRNALCADPECQLVIIPGATHDDFGDGVLLKWPLRAWHATDAYTTLRSINESVIQFLGNALQKGKR